MDIQGSVKEHAESLRRLGVMPVLVKLPEDLEGLSGLIIPGGESATIGKLLKRFSLDAAIKKRAKEGMAIWGTCAGAILLAKRLAGGGVGDAGGTSGVGGAGGEKVVNLGLMDITVERNAYGRQLDSFETQIEFDLGGGAMGRLVPAIFIRAPKIAEAGKNVKVLARDKGWITAAREGKFLATTFHPELSDDLCVHRYFVDMCL